MFEFIIYQSLIAAFLSRYNTPVNMSGDQFVPQYEPQAALLADYRHQDSQGRSVALPDDWPTNMKSPMAWTAQNLQSRHIFQLTESEVQEAMNWGCAYSGVSRADFLERAQEYHVTYSLTVISRLRTMHRQSRQGICRSATTPGKARTSSAEPS